MATWEEPANAVQARIELQPRRKPIREGNKGSHSHLDDERLSAPSVIWDWMREAGLAESSDAQTREN